MFNPFATYFGITNMNIPYVVLLVTKYYCACS